MNDAPIDLNNTHLKEKNKRPFPTPNSDSQGQKKGP